MQRQAALLPRFGILGNFRYRIRNGAAAVAKAGVMQDHGKNGKASAIGFAGEARGRDYERWVEEICYRLVNVEVRPLHDGPVACTMHMTELPGVRLGMFEGSALRFTAKPSSSEPRLYLQIPEDVNLELVHGPRTMTLDRGQLALVDAAQVGAQTTVTANGRFRTFGIDRKALLALCPDAEDRIVRPLGIAPKFVSLIRHYHEFASGNAPGLDAEARAVLGQHIVDLTALALGAGRDGTESARARGLAAARLAAIKKTILDNLSNPQLSAATIASSQRITPRYLHMLFAQEGMTYTEFVLSHRLARVHRVLSDRRFDRQPIGDIAFAIGFNDLSYFNRTFRRRYGATPSDVRERARRGGG